MDTCVNTLVSIPNTKETAAARGVKPTTVWRLTKRGLLNPNRATRCRSIP